MPSLVVDCNRTVASPAPAAFVVVSNSVPSPVTENVIVFVAVIIGLSPESHIADVINDVLVPSADMDIGLAVFKIFVGEPTVTTSTVPSFRSVEVAFTVAAPIVVVDCNFTVASPVPAALVVVSNNVPSPVTENVIVFVAVVIGLSPALHIVAVINDVDEPSALMLVGFAVFIILVGPSSTFLVIVHWSIKLSLISYALAYNL
ncbi:hypothetical protein ES703_97378 [subsurface metagenome]